MLNSRFESAGFLNFGNEFIKQRAEITSKYRVTHKIRKYSTFVRIVTTSVLHVYTISGIGDTVARNNTSSISFRDI